MASTIDELIKSASDPSTTNFLDLLQGRAYAKETITIYLDEALGMRLQILNDRLENLQLPTEKTDEAVDLINEIQGKIEEIEGALRKGRVILHLTGISDGAREDILEKARKEFPVEYDADVNPFTGVTVRTEKANELRDRYAGYLVWEASIEKIEGEGIEPHKPTLEEVVALRRTAPFGAVLAIAQKIDDLRVASAWIDLVHDDDFFPSA